MDYISKYIADFEDLIALPNFIDQPAGIVFHYHSHYICHAFLPY